MHGEGKLGTAEAVAAAMVGPSANMVYGMFTPICWNLGGETQPLNPYNSTASEPLSSKQSAVPWFM
jgi:hypothetical protein